MNPLVGEYGVAGGAVFISSAVCYLLHPYLELTNLVMVYLVGTLLVATRGRRGPAALSSFLSVLCFDFLFVQPRFRFSVADTQYLWTFIVMFTVAMIISHLTIRLREEAEAARQGDQRSTWLMEKAKKAEIDVETERMRSSLLSSVSHDLRTPLTTIVGSAGALLEKEDISRDPKARELLENIQTEAERLSHLVQNLLDSTRFDSGPVQVLKEKVPLEEVVESALARLAKGLSSRAVHVHLPDGLPLIPMDPTMIGQVLINLLENAIRHTPKESAIDLSAEVVDGHGRISVSDRGAGLQPGEHDKVFDKFYHSPHSPGSGLGLAICRAIVQAHGGRIWAEDRPGGGARFCFDLPLGEVHGT